MDHSLQIALEINLGWIDQPAYRQRLLRQVDAYRSCCWMFDLASRLQNGLSQCRIRGSAGGIMQLRFCPLTETAALMFGISCCTLVVEEITALLQEDEGLRWLPCFRASRDRKSGLVGHEPVLAMPVLA